MKEALVVVEGDWIEQTIVADPKGAERVEGEILSALQESHFTHEEIFGVRLALGEAWSNVIKHAHQGDISKTMRVRYRIAEGCFSIEITDQGEGFDPDDLPDPVDPVNLERLCGRGTFLMRHFMTTHDYKNNTLVMSKQRTIANGTAVSAQVRYSTGKRLNDAMTDTVTGR